MRATQLFGMVQRIEVYRLMHKLRLFNPENSMRHVRRLRCEPSRVQYQHTRGALPRPESRHLEQLLERRFARMKQERYPRLCPGHLRGREDIYTRISDWSQGQNLRTLPIEFDQYGSSTSASAPFQGSSDSLPEPLGLAASPFGLHAARALGRLDVLFH